MQIAVIGTGYVGLVSGACFAEFGINVTCADIDEEKIQQLGEGHISFYEPGLSEKVQANVEQGRLGFTTDVAAAIRDALVVLIAVGTPANRDGTPNLDAIETVAREIGRNLSGYKVVVTKSTVPPRTGERVRSIIEAEAEEGVEFDVVSNPEFLREGSAVEDFMRPDRIVVGAESKRAVDIMKELYGPLYLIETPFIITDVPTAEMIKYASNVFLATKISFINEIANVCERVGADVHQVARAMGLDGRISPKFLHPGPGFGGSCFPKDVSALVSAADSVDYDFKIGKAVLEVNSRQRQFMVDKIIAAAAGDVDGKEIGFFGLAFKPNTDDMRDSPTIDIIQRLQEAGARIRAYDPAAMDNARRIFDGIEYCSDAYEVAVDADVLVVATEWNQFRNLDLEQVRDSMRSPIVVDLRNIYDPKKMATLGFTYDCIGRPPAERGWEAAVG
ncbi:MAG: UDP-glucose/GDP-mannose dehydrogenase family protein [Acidobacteria bacterium]|nr:UDP-glucose/GDP-mannose dehydrogenase family protein [Acidobacteriota bacterium]